MEIVLQQDFPALGYTGDRVNVKPGYARNFLIPRGIAVEVASRNAKLLKHRMAGINAKRAKLKAEAEAFGKSLEHLTLEFTIKVGASGKSFGSITVRDVDAELKKKDISLDKRQIRVVDHIKGPGEYRAEIKLHSDVVVPVKIKVIAEKVAAPAGAEGESGKARKRRKKDEESEAAAEETQSSGESAEAPAEEA